jgi:hypothetical protein
LNTGLQRLNPSQNKMVERLKLAGIGEKAEAKDTRLRKSVSGF